MFNNSEFYGVSVEIGMYVVRFVAIDINYTLESNCEQSYLQTPFIIY